MAASDISDRYLKKAIAEINELGAEHSRSAGPVRATEIGSGHPQAAVVQIKSMQRLRVDPTAIYGTNCIKYLEEPEDEARAFVIRELHVVQPKLVVVMGEDARIFLNECRFPLAAEVEDQPGVLQPMTPTIEALVTPDIDASLDDQASKRAFWEAFKALGPWWSELPPY